MVGPWELEGVVTLEELGMVHKVVLKHSVFQMPHILLAKYYQNCCSIFQFGMGTFHVNTHGMHVLFVTVKMYHGDGTLVEGTMATLCLPVIEQ